MWNRHHRIVTRHPPAALHQNEAAGDLALHSGAVRSVQVWECRHPDSERHRHRRFFVSYSEQQEANGHVRLYRIHDFHWPHRHDARTDERARRK